MQGREDLLRTFSRYTSTVRLWHGQVGHLGRPGCYGHLNAFRHGGRNQSGADAGCGRRCQESGADVVAASGHDQHLAESALVTCRRTSGQV